MSETVAIITRTKSRPRLLTRCIRSILDQTFRDWLHVIVNDGGNAKEVDDMVYQFAAEYGGRFKIVHHEQSRGMEAASNSALQTITTEYVAFLDDDDTWHPDFLASMIGALIQAPNIQVKSAICQTEVVREAISGDEVIELSREFFNPSFICLRLDDLVIENQFTNNAIVFRRSVVDEIGYFNEKLDALGDWDFNLRLHLRYDAVVLDQPLARWHWRVQNNENPYENSIHVGNLHKMARAQIINDAIRGKWLDGSELLLILVLGQKLNELRRQLEAELRSKELELRHVMAQRDAVRTERDAIRADRDVILHSTTWRVTGPIRRVVAFILGR